MVNNSEIVTYSEYEEALELLKQKRLNEALSLYKQALAKHPMNPDVHHDMGVCLLHLNDSAGALDAMNRAVDLQPDYSYRYSSRAFIKGSIKDYNGAVADYKQAIALDPEDAIAQNNLGLILEQMGYINEAKNRFEAADELSGILKKNNIDLPTNERYAEKSQRTDNKPDETVGIQSEIKKVLSTRTGLSEFLTFILRGFKLPK